MIRLSAAGILARGRHFPVALLILTLLGGCQSGTAARTPDYPVTIIPPVGIPTLPMTPPVTSEPVGSPTFQWDAVTLLPPRTPEASAEVPARTPELAPQPGLLTEADLGLLVAGRHPFSLSDVEISLGRMVLPVDLLSLAQHGPFTVRSIPFENDPSWQFLAFTLPLPRPGELGPIVRAPISGEVMAGTFHMINEQTVQVVNIDHPLSRDQLLRATLVYTGTIEPLFVMNQQVDAGEALFRLTRDSGRVDSLGNTPIPEGATLTLHASIDTITPQPSGVEKLDFLSAVSLTTAGFLRDEDGFIISPVD